MEKTNSIRAQNIKLKLWSFILTQLSLQWFDYLFDWKNDYYKIIITKIQIYWTKLMVHGSRVCSLNPDHNVIVQASPARINKTKKRVNYILCPQRMG